MLNLYQLIRNHTDADGIIDWAAAQAEFDAYQGDLFKIVDLHVHNNFISAPNVLKNAVPWTGGGAARRCEWLVRISFLKEHDTDESV